MKKILLSLFVGFVGIISFCSAGTFSIEGNIKDGFNAQMPIPQRYFSKDFTVRCEFDRSNLANCGGYVFKFNFYFAQIYSNTYIYSTLVNTNTTFYVYCGDTTPAVLEYDFSTYTPPAGPNQNYNGVSFLQFNSIYNAGVDVPYSCTFVGDNILSAGSSSCPECPTCDPQYTSEQCQSVYGLVSSGLLSTCENNYNSCQSDLSSCQSFTSGFNSELNNCSSNLIACNTSLTSCLHSNCPETELSYSKFYVRHGESTWSELTGMENYYVYLPEYLGYNYDYSNGTDLNFTVGVVTDTGYINNISAIQNSKPSQEDLNKLISEVLPLFVPGLAVILLLYFIFRFIKKIF